VYVCIYAGRAWAHLLKLWAKSSWGPGEPGALPSRGMRVTRMMASGEGYVSRGWSPPSCTITTCEGGGGGGHMVHGGEWSVTDNVIDTEVPHPGGPAWVRHTSNDNVPPYASPNTRTHLRTHTHSLTLLTHIHTSHKYTHSHTLSLKDTRIHTEALRVRTHMDADVDYVISRGLHPHHVGLSDTVQSARLRSTAKHLLPREENVGAGALGCCLGCGALGCCLGCGACCVYRAVVVGGGTIAHSARK
jgi:hypothetical protein